MGSFVIVREKVIIFYGSKSCAEVSGYILKDDWRIYFFKIHSSNIVKIYDLRRCGMNYAHKMIANKKAMIKIKF